MGIIEDLFLNAKTAVDSVGKKAEKVIDASKLSLTAADLKAEISKKYEILGRVVFEQKSTGKNYDKSINELVEKIGELTAELNSVNEMIANAKQKSKCQFCGTYNVKGAVFCNKCGEKLAAENKDNDDDTLSPDDAVDLAEDNFDDEEIGF